MRQADAKSLEWALDYISAVPATIDRILVDDPTSATGRSLPYALSLDDERSLLQLLPDDAPPFPPASELAGTPYRLLELLGTGGFGAVYRASSPSLQHLPLAIKFCLDRSFLHTLNQERSNLERLMRAEGQGAAHVVRLYGYDLDHSTPYLVYEYVEGGDLTRHLAARRAALGNNPDATEILGWIVQIAEGLAFAHRAGLVHRDLKPANVLVDGTRLKLADFGIGGVAADRIVARSRIGASTMDYLSLADQASLFRGAGTPLYMSPEQRKGASPDPRHDLYALGVVWYQLLTGDVARELHHGWAKELAVRFGVPSGHIGLIERCVGWFDDRPVNAGELLPLLKEAAGMPATPAVAPAPGPGVGLPVPPSTPVAETVTSASAKTAVPTAVDDPRRVLATSLVNRLHQALEKAEYLKSCSYAGPAIRGVFVGIGMLLVSASFSREPVLNSPPNVNAPNEEESGGFNYVFVFVAGILPALIYTALSSWRLTSSRRVAQAEIANAAKELADNFAELVAENGGPAALKNPESVELLRHRLARASVQSGTRTSVLASLVARLEHTRASLEALDSWPMWVTIVWGFFPALLLGWLSGEIVFAYRNRTPFPAAFGPSYGDDWTANLTGFVVGVLTWLIYVRLIRDYKRPSEHFLQGQVNGIVKELSWDFPTEVESVGGPSALDNLSSVRRMRDDLAIRTGPTTPTAGLTMAQLPSEPQRRVLAIARFKDVLLVRSSVENSVGFAWVGLGLLWIATALFTGILAYHAQADVSTIVQGARGTIPEVHMHKPPQFRLYVIAAIVLGLFLAWLEWEGMAAIRRFQQMRWTSAVDEFSNEYPRLVAEWGGRQAFDNPENLRRDSAHPRAGVGRKQGISYAGLWRVTLDSGKSRVRMERNRRDIAQTPQRGLGQHLWRLQAADVRERVDRLRVPALHRLIALSRSSHVAALSSDTADNCSSSQCSMMKLLITRRANNRSSTDGFDPRRSVHMAAAFSSRND